MALRWRVWESYFAMVLLGLALGIATGGVPDVLDASGAVLLNAGRFATLAIVLAMTFSLSEVRFRGLSAREEALPTARSVALNYGVLTAFVLALSLAYPDPAIRNGWVVIAAAPSAVAIVPITSVFGGNVRRALVSTASVYLLALAAFPAITLAFAGQAADYGELAVQILLLIVLPLGASRLVLLVPALLRRRPVLVNVSFFALVFAITGANRDVFFGDLGLVAVIAAGAFLRTWGIGAVAYGLSGWRGRGPSERLQDALFASLKNLGLSALFAFALFGRTAALPAIVCLFFEVSWILALARRYRR